MQRGTVAVYKQAGFGFIAPEGGGADVFFHVQDVRGGSHCPRPGDTVTFEVQGTAKGPRAVKVYVVAAAAPPQLAEAAALPPVSLPDGECEVFSRAEFHAQVWAALERKAAEIYSDLEALAVRAGWVDG